MKKTLTLIGLRREVYTSLMNCNERKRYASKMKYKTWQTFSTCHHLKKRTVYENRSKKSLILQYCERNELQLYLNFRAKNDQIELSYSENIFCAKIQRFKNWFLNFHAKNDQIELSNLMIFGAKIQMYLHNICTKKIVKSIRKFAIFSNIFFVVVVNYST